MLGRGMSPAAHLTAVVMPMGAALACRGIVTTRWLLVVERCAMLLSGSTSSGRLSCSSRPCTTMAVSKEPKITKIIQAPIDLSLLRCQNSMSALRQLKYINRA